MDGRGSSTSPSRVVHGWGLAGPHPAPGLSTVAHKLLHTMCPDACGAGARLCPQTCPHAVHEAWSGSRAAAVRVCEVTQSHPCSHGARTSPAGGREQSPRTVASRLGARERAGRRSSGNPARPRRSDAMSERDAAGGRATHDRAASGFDCRTHGSTARRRCSRGRRGVRGRAIGAARPVPAPSSGAAPCSAAEGSKHRPLRGTRRGAVLTMWPASP